MCKSLRIDAYTAALQDLRAHTTDTKRYLEVAAKLAEAQALANVPTFARTVSFIRPLALSPARAPANPAPLPSRAL